jgi:MYXO-CTERM domain-containing protein
LCSEPTSEVFTRTERRARAPGIPPSCGTHSRRPARRPPTPPPAPHPDDDFRLPIRLGLINASGPQDLLVHILSTKGRFEAANYPNVPLPTEIEVKEQVRASFPAFYAALFDGLLARNPGAVVTEYAWDARTCDPCPDAPLNSAELTSLGMDVLFDGKDVLGMPMVRQAALTLEGPHTKDLVRRILRAHINEIRACYNQVLASQPNWAANVRIDFTIAKTGKVTAASLGAGAEHGIDACIVDRVKKWVFPRDAAPTTVQAPIWLTRDLAGARSFVLTRLHARYDAASLGEDLVFRTAAPIANGSHGGAGPFVQAAQSWQDNQFQGRFILRNPWTGAIDCADPQRGHYTGEPKNGKKQVQAVTDAAFAPRGGVDLASLTTSPILALADPIRPLPAPKPWTSPTPPEPTPAAPPPTPAGCGCRTDAPAGLGLLLVAAPLLRRRRLATAATNR